MLTDPLATLKRYIDQPSGSFDREDTARLSEIIAEDLASLGFAVRRHPGLKHGPSLTGTLGNGPAQLMLMGHMDTVFSHDRFVPYTEAGDGRVKGSGIMDMKGGIVILLYALKKAIPRIDLSRYRLCVVLNADEETGSAESGELILETARSSFAALSYEPCGLNGRLTCARKGVQNVLIRCKGKPGHAGSEYFRCASANEALCKHIAHLYSLRDEAREISFNAGVLSGGTAENVVAAEAEARCEFRFFNQDYAPVLRERILAICAEEPVPGVETEVSFGNSHAAIDLNERSRTLLDLALAISEEQGVTRFHEKTGGAGDISIAGQAGIGVLDGLGMPGGGMHTLEEYALTDRIGEQIEFSANLITRICK